MEYVPDDALLGPFVDHLATIKPDQEQRLRRIYDLFHSESGIERPDLEQLVQSLGVDVDNALTQQLLDQSPLLCHQRQEPQQEQEQEQEQEQVDLA